MGLDDLQDMMESAEEEDAVMEGIGMLMSEDNIDVKTDIPDPLRLAILEQWAAHLEDKFVTLSDMDRKEVKSAQTLRNIAAKLKLYMISKGRKSREELVKVLTAKARAKEEEKEELKDKLMERE